MKEAYDPDKDDVSDRRVDKFMQHYQVAFSMVGCSGCGVRLCDLMQLDISLISCEIKSRQ